ncbi:MAG: type II toxin-antitoxin system VapC family toxin [Holosporales bacterium]|jgi:ribonuclease VapC
MLLDTSALFVLLEEEPESAAFIKAISADSYRAVSAVSLVEAGMLAQARRGDNGALALDLLLQRLSGIILPFTATQARLARSAYKKYGKGRHPAGLNFGDCCVYAAAKETGEPLLCKGSDFPQTDIALVPW